MSKSSRRRQFGSAGLFDGFIELHVLYAARKSPVSVSLLVELLTNRGYKVSNQAILALLRRFERRNWLRAQRGAKVAGAVRLFEITREGKKALQISQPLVSALLKEISSEPLPASFSSPRVQAK